MDEQLTEEEFEEQHVDGVGVQLAYRVYWLLQNGYEVTRENLVDVDLPTKEMKSEVPEDIDGEHLTKERLEELLNG